MDLADALQAVEQVDPEVVIPAHYNVPFLWKKKIALADDQEFKHGVEALGKRCCVLGAGDSVTL
jgi:L-ascorbate metabolism protein UlaG (beta-lactamase superfamily)